MLSSCPPLPRLACATSRLQSPCLTRCADLLTSARIYSYSSTHPRYLRDFTSRVAIDGRLQLLRQRRTTLRRSPSCTASIRASGQWCLPHWVTAEEPVRRSLRFREGPRRPRPKPLPNS